MPRRGINPSVYASTSLVKARTKVRANPLSDPVKAIRRGGMVPSDIVPPIPGPTVRPEYDTSIVPLIPGPTVRPEQYDPTLSPSPGKRPESRITTPAEPGVVLPAPTPLPPNTVDLGNGYLYRRDTGKIYGMVSSDPREQPVEITQIGANLTESFKTQLAQQGIVWPPPPNPNTLEPNPMAGAGTGVPLPGGLFFRNGKVYDARNVEYNPTDPRELQRIRGMFRNMASLRGYYWNPSPRIPASNTGIPATKNPGTSIVPRLGNSGGAAGVMAGA